MKSRTPHFLLLLLIFTMGTALTAYSGSYRPSAQVSELSIQRLVTAPLGAELTGLELSHNGDLFFNLQHPSSSNTPPNHLATIGVIEGVNFNALPPVDELSLPLSFAEKQRVRTAVGHYKILAQEGDTLNDSVPDGIGSILSMSGDRVIKLSNDPDFNSFIPAQADHNAGYLFTSWEDRPGGMSRMTMEKDPQGQWSVSEGMMIDFSPVKGTWINCFGTTSPWNTPLASEELYFDNTADWNNPDFTHIQYTDALTDYLQGIYPNPYDYGYIIEIKEPAGSPIPVKHYAMGRFSHENAVVMPDNKTVYLSDDGTGTVLFKFIADKANDLSSGTLYAAKVTQDVNEKDPAKAGFDIRWIKLAHSTNTEIRHWIEDYQKIDKSAYIHGRSSYITDQQIADWAAGKARDDRVAFLESRKAAAAKGATAEFRKMEGININYPSAKNASIPVMYLAMSSIDMTMSDDTGDIQLDENKCGVVYAMALTQGYDVARMLPVLAGGQYDADNNPYSCPAEAVANPDNLLVLRDGRVIIGEDSNKHENNMLWIATPK